jgi:hypothetical protein
MRTIKKQFIFFPRKVVTESNDNFISKTKILCLCRVKTVTNKFLDHKSTTHYSLKMKNS